MSVISAADVGKLRSHTGAGLMDCKKALSESGGDFEKAVDWLRKKGKQIAEKKADREIKAGAVLAQVDVAGKLGVMLEIGCETDFVARNEDFQAFSRDVALQIAAMNPQFVRKEEVSADVVAKEREVLLAKAKESGKPEPVIQKMVDGQIAKWMKEICLLDQSWVKDPDRTIEAVQQELISKIGENIKIRRFVRFELGEGLEKKTSDFAAEVAAAAGQA